MDFTDSFLNMGWICVKNITRPELLDLIGFEGKEHISFERGIETVQLAYDEPILVCFKVDEWFFLLGKYYFTNLDLLKRFSKKFPVAYCFGLDVWSAFYCLLKQENGNFKEVYWWNDGAFTAIGEISTAKLQGDSDEKVNLILDLSELWTVPFIEIENVVNEKGFNVELIQQITTSKH